MPAYHQVLKRNRQCMPHVKFARNIWRRHNDSERFSLMVDLWRKVPAIRPEVIDTPFDALWLVCSWNFAQALSLCHWFRSSVKGGLISPVPLIDICPFLATVDVLPSDPVAIQPPVQVQSFQYELNCRCDSRRFIRLFYLFD